MTSTTLFVSTVFYEQCTTVSANSVDGRMNKNVNKNVNKNQTGIRWGILGASAVVLAALTGCTAPESSSTPKPDITLKVSAPPSTAQKLPAGVLAVDDDWQLLSVTKPSSSSLMRALVRNAGKETRETLVTITYTDKDGTVRSWIGGTGAPLRPGTKMSVTLLGESTSAPSGELGFKAGL